MERKPILLAVPEGLLREIDSAVDELGMSRTRFLLDSAEKHLRFVCEVELPALRQGRQNADSI